MSTVKRTSSPSRLPLRLAAYQAPTHNASSHTRENCTPRTSKLVWYLILGGWATFEWYPSPPGPAQQIVIVHMCSSGAGARRTITSRGVCLMTSGITMSSPGGSFVSDVTRGRRKRCTAFAPSARLNL